MAEGIGKLSDHAAKLDPSGKFAKLVNLMEKNNEILEDMIWEEGNLPTGHETTYRLELPEFELVGYNQGVSPTKTRNAKIRETAGTMMGMSQVDTRLVQLQNKQAEYLADEERAFYAASNIKFANLLLHETEAHPNSINGLLTRYSYGFPFKQDEKWLQDIVFKNIIDAGGTGNNCGSILLVNWSKDNVFGFYPKGSSIGLRKVEMGRQLVPDDKGNPYTAFVTQYYWDFGLVVRDPRQIVRIVNIDLDALKSDAKTGANLIELMIWASESLYNRNGRPAIYMNRRLRTWMRLQKINKSNANFTFDSIEGKEVIRFDGIPCRIVDAMDIPEVAEAKP